MKSKSAPTVSKAAPKPAGKGEVKVVGAKRSPTTAPSKKVPARKAAAPAKTHVVWVTALKVGGGRSRKIYGSAMQPKHRTTEEIAAAVAVASAA
jgi:hypothetical protein